MEPVTADMAKLLNQRPVVVALVLTFIALAESTIAPWAPLIILYAIFCIVIPLASGSCYFGSFKRALAAYWHLLLISLVFMLIWDKVFTGTSFFLRTVLPVFIETAGVKLHVNASLAKMVFSFFILIWAPIGEEFLYRGYLQGNLRQSMSFMKAVLIAASFFAVRHGLHLLFLYPAVPWATSAIWVILAFGWGIALGWLYERSRSLYLPIAAHLLANCFSLF